MSAPWPVRFAAIYPQCDARRAVELYAKSLHAHPNRWGWYVSAASDHGSLDLAVQDLDAR